MTTQDPPSATTECIAGCGPAGAVPGLLLARAGIDDRELQRARGHGPTGRDREGRARAEAGVPAGTGARLRGPESAVAGRPPTDDPR